MIESDVFRVGTTRDEAHKSDKASLLRAIYKQWPDATKGLILSTKYFSLLTVNIESDWSSRKCALYQSADPEK
jgi:hypothetical protein